ncbi:MAG: spore coat protein U domain-containing protein [Gammaproteobacteria bacterium]
MSSAPNLPTSRGITRARQRTLRTWHMLPLLFAGACEQTWAVPACTVASTATLSFGSVVALASTGDISTNTGGTFWVNCTSEVTTVPSLYSATPRTLVSGANSLAFTLSTSSPGGTELSTAPPGTSLGIVRDSTNQTVTLYGLVMASNFKSLRSGFYTTSIALTIEY